MTANGEAFIEWALDAGRTVEERFTALLLVERLAREFKDWNWEQRRLEYEARRYNPAWEPKLIPAEVQKAAEKLDEVKVLILQNHDDRPVRNIEVLRFLPNLSGLHEIGGVTNLEPLRHVPGLVTLHMGMDSEATDLSPLRHLRELTTLTIGGKVQEDFRPVAHCLKLESITVYCRFPWPRMEGWEELTGLVELRWHGSALGFLGIPCLPALRWLEVECGNFYSMEGCMRDLHQLPEMPGLRVLWAKHFFYMDGIERYRKLQSALAAGPFRTAAPAASLPELTHLRLWSDELREVGSLAAAPALHHLVVHGKRPQDYSGLSDAPQLREVLAFGCETSQVDVDMLRVVLPDWDEYFLAQQPRALKELRHILPEGEERLPRDPPSASWPVNGEAWEENPSFQQSAHRWCCSRLRDALDARGLRHEAGFLISGYERRLKRTATSGYPWMQAPARSSRLLMMSVLGPPALSRLRDLVECVRAFLTTLRHPWGLQILGTPSPDDDDWEREWVSDDSEEAEREEERQRAEQKRKEQELMAQELRLKLLQEQGVAPDPKDFGLKPPPAQGGANKGNVATAVKPDDDKSEDEEKPPMKFDAPNLDWNDRNDEDDAQGGIKDADPKDEDEHWLKPPPNVDPNTFWSGLRLYLHLTEDELYIPRHNMEAVDHLMSRGNEDG